MNSRRRFMRQAALAALGLSSPMTSITNLKAINMLMGRQPTFGDYKAIVCFFLHGGNDSFNMLMPRLGTEYNNYATTRSNLAIPQEDILALGGLSGNYGVHPSMPKIQQLYEDGDLAFISNLGSLIAPMSKSAYYDGTVPKPLGLFSHLDQYKHWQSAQPNLRTNKGWAGKMADLLASENGNTEISMNISLSGANILQRGDNSIAFNINSSGATLPTNRNAPWGHNPQRRAAMDSILNYNYSEIYKKTYVDIFRGAIATGELFQNAIDEVPDFDVQFSDNNISEGFEIIAKTIAARDTLDFSRQIFFIKYGGWDHHDGLLAGQAAKLGVVDNALSEFKIALEEIGMLDNVTTIVISEFARTLTSNGNGTDHAWGGNSIVMGGSVNGGEIYGEYPSLEIDNDLYLGRGAIIPTTAADSVFSELALWYGISPMDLLTVFPNLGNFHDVSSLSVDNLPIGFMDV